ncbi:MAG: Glycosyl transferase, group 1 family protein [uncultured bacterium]|nr:MAG: Glycosyl transferase, group 1 family protein [uncultured bacterium]KKT75210.1 MAG: Glycosyl transferase group 1 [Candidatus Peregrinibacteria bacterium GW2011_GWA2_44_7]
MKIVYIANNRIPTEKAHGLQITKTCEAFLNRGIDLLLWIPRRKQSENLKGVNIETYYGLNHKIPTYHLWTLDFLMLRSKYALPEILGIIAYWLQCWTFYFSIFIKLLGGPRIRLYSRDFPIIALGVLLKYPCYYEAHQVPSRIVMKKFYSAILGRVNGIITINNQLKEIYHQEFEIPLDKILIAPDGVDLSRFHLEDKIKARKKLRLNPNSKILVYTGNLYRWKGVYTLVSAMKNIDDSKIEMIVVGGDRHDGDLEKLKSFVKKRKIPRVNLVGHVFHSKIVDYLAAADVLILPNSGLNPMSRDYTSPLKLFEYMAAKRPIIASNVPALLEVLDETMALFFNADDEEDLTCKIQYIIRNKKEAKKIADAAHREVKKYTWDKRTEKIIRFMKSSI